MKAYTIIRRFIPATQRRPPGIDSPEMYLPPPAQVTFRIMYADEDAGRRRNHAQPFYAAG